MSFNKLIPEISPSVRFPRIDFTAGKLAQEKAAQKKWRENPGQIQIVKLADDDNQWNWCMNGHKPPERQFPEPAANVPEWQIDNKCGQAGVKKPPFKREHVVKKKFHGLVF